MISITIFGSGNVATHLIKAFSCKEEVSFLQVFARNKKELSTRFPHLNIVPSQEELVKTDVFILSVTDSAVEKVASSIPFKDSLIVHTSGSLSIEVLSNCDRRGVFYPLQTFSKERDVSWQNIPIAIETASQNDESILFFLAKLLSNKVYLISSQQRKQLHLAAVFVCNFVNHLYTIGHQLCEDHNIDVSLLQPLIEETAKKISMLSPKQAQTGPAKRNDTLIINSHLAMLENPIQKQIYTLLTQSIQQHEQKL